MKLEFSLVRPGLAPVWLRWLAAALLLSLAWMSMTNARALAAQPGWIPGPHAIGENTYDGFVDFPVEGASIAADSSFHVAGWAADRTSLDGSGIDDVHVYVGRAGEGGRFLAKGQVGLSRPDVASVTGKAAWDAPGFDAVVPAHALQAGTHTLTVYVHSPTKGWWSRHVSVTITAPTSTAATTTTATATPSSTGTSTTTLFSNDPLVQIIRPVPNTTVSTADDYLIKGIALDRNASSAQGIGVDRVEIYIRGERGTGSARFLGRANIGEAYGHGADYGSQFEKAGFGLEFKPTNFRAGAHTLYIYARSSVSGKETLLEVPFEIVEGS